MKENLTKQIHHIEFNLTFAVGPITVLVSPLLAGGWGYTLWREDNAGAEVWPVYLCLGGATCYNWTAEQAADEGEKAAKAKV